MLLIGLLVNGAVEWFDLPFNQSSDGLKLVPLRNDIPHKYHYLRDTSKSKGRKLEKLHFSSKSFLAMPGISFPFRIRCRSCLEPVAAIDLTSHPEGEDMSKTWIQFRLLQARGSSPSGFAESRRFGQREQHDFFASHRADVMVQAQDSGACDLLDHGFKDRS